MCSSDLAKCYNNKAKKNSVIIPNPIIDNLPEPLPLLRQEVVSVGRLAPEKNHKILISAFSLFHKTHNKYKLIIYGSGPLKQELLTLAYEKGLDDSCFEIVEGKRNIAELINGADLFVLPSNVEGMPNALIEAMAMGLTCISTDCPAFGSRMLIENGQNGYLIPVGSHEELLKAMEDAIIHQNRNTLRLAAIGVRDKLNPSTIFNCWIDYFNKVVNA